MCANTNIFISTQLNGFKFKFQFCLPQLNDFHNSKWLNSSIWHIDGTLTGTTTPGLSVPGVMAMKGYSTFLKATSFQMF